jgi:hypothetical protein
MWRTWSMRRSICTSIQRILVLLRCSIAVSGGPGEMMRSVPTVLECPAPTELLTANRFYEPSKITNMPAEKAEMSNKLFTERGGRFRWIAIN